MTIANGAAALEWHVSANVAHAGELLHISASAVGAESISILQNERVLGRIAGAKGELTLDSATMGTGPVLLRAEAKMADATLGHVSAAPQTVEIQSAAKH